MPETKIIVATKAAIGIPCPKKSALKKDLNGRPIPGEFEHVELKHVTPGQPIEIDAKEADRLISLGFATEVKASAPTKPEK